MPHNLNQIFKALSSTIQAEFYPYAGVKHSIRKRHGYILIRISDTFIDAPHDVLLSLGSMLLAKMNKTPVDRTDRRIYNQYIASEAFQKKAAQITTHRRRKVKIIKGRYKSLEKSFHRVNNHYFKGTMKKPILTWSIKRAKRTFGRYDPERDVVVISRLLDSQKIPEEFLDFIMYHELLHKKHGVTIKNGRRRVHTPQFKADEKAFHNYKEMKKLMETLAQ